MPKVANQSQKMRMLCNSMGNLVLTLLVCLQSHLGIHDAIDAARLEESFQMDEWGLVEGGHDIDIADMKVRVAGPTVFLRLLQGSQ